MTDSAAPYAPPPPPAAFTPAPRTGRQSMVFRHLASLGIAFFVTPVGILLFDYGAGRYLRERAINFGEGTEGIGWLVLLFAGGLVLLMVALTGRISGLGPVVAGLLWGLVPLLWFVIDLTSFYDFSRDLPSTHFWFSNPPFLFGLVAPLLIGSGLAGRWRGAQRP